MACQEVTIKIKEVGNYEIQIFNVSKEIKENDEIGKLTECEEMNCKYEIVGVKSNTNSNILKSIKLKESTGELYIQMVANISAIKNVKQNK